MFWLGTKAQARTAWERLKLHTNRMLNVNYYRPGEYAGPRHLRLWSWSHGRTVIRGLFGIDMHATYFTVNPSINKLGEVTPWKLTHL